jgi:hypothetical protein
VLPTPLGSGEGGGGASAKKGFKDSLTRVMAVEKREGGQCRSGGVRAH